MGLNSLSDILIISMRYYTDIDNTKYIKAKLKSYLTQTKQEQHILTQEGLYKYNKNKLFKFKLFLKDDNIHEDNTSHIINESKIQPSNFRWIKDDDMYNIPILHNILNIKIEIYKLNPKSSTTFFIETVDGNINDYYFESKENIDNYFLQEDINSFLSLVK